ncbi:phytanoyl-CoA dioxygenase PhyH [Roseibium hamelinense]|uniref:Phytanoyl-CoA dioxygenase PhyH n=1 Tax=Roseibium hamelinense TaxID=150831 RepID=A0A562TJ16_9HYPH|nr:phytanoyl-CoA dioxygenase family protein [Roseibium hamelinense]MTI42608.1 phytanoyl-CoA dioxygenase [Roseibium hamelinense]TWI93354.1 phytanoyl-CoA dioxygenase PhyH [Roseibium hamelinense]
MNFTSILKSPLWVLGVAGTDKSPRKNPILGNEWLNKNGLHRQRVSLAAGMAAWRRKRLGSRISDEAQAHFDENGYFLTENFLSDAEFEALKREVYGKPFQAREMRQGQTVTRMTPLPPTVLQDNPALAACFRNKDVMAQIRYASSRGGQPLGFLQTVIAEPSIDAKDPQTDLHADTFHATSKAWLFLHDVGEEDGPFCYVPGSHKLTSERLEWEYQCSLTASKDPRSHHASGSFRIRQNELEALGLPPAKRMAVKANTLVVADTFGFHGRTPSDKPTTRVEMHWHMRRNPFLPWNGLDVKSLPLIKERELAFFMTVSDAMEKHLRQRHIWRDVGAVPVDGPANI